MEKVWPIFKGNNKPHNGICSLPEAPAWRRFEGEIAADYLPQDPCLEDPEQYISQAEGQQSQAAPPRGSTYISSEKERELVNAALFLRRPLLITGKPGTGKSSLAYAVAYELRLGRVLHWPITSRSSLQEALYRYDAIGRLHKANLAKGKKEPDIGNFIRLGPLGTALLPTRYPQVLLIDEIDKSNIDLPNDLLNIFEVGEYEIPELARLPKKQSEVQVLPQFGNTPVTIRNGRVICHTFPFVVITSNGERDMPPPFLRRCVRLDIDEPNPQKLARIVEAHFKHLSRAEKTRQNRLIRMFLERREDGDLATDQLLNAIYLTLQGVSLDASKDSRETLLEAVLKYLNPQDPG